MDYNELNLQLISLVSDCPHFIANLANVSALIYNTLEELNWAGFYLMKDGKLVLGPFQGKVACIEIPVGRGVCGIAVQEDKTQLVMDVHKFAGHIACDSASQSEIVIPIHANGKVVAVLDIDSPYVGRFSPKDQVGLELLVSSLETKVFGCYSEKEIMI